MININGVSKTFDDICAIKHVTLNIQEGMVFGLIGTNGAGKSTLLRMLSGVFKPDEGTILVDGEPVYDNVKVKSEIFYLSDEQYFFPEAAPATMAEYYNGIYPKYDLERFYALLEKFRLDRKRKMKTFSKGMKRQVAFLLGICANTKYLLCDETFDGLDPLMRQGMKSLFAKEVAERDFTPVIASHNLRELEDICDSIGLLHQGGVLLSEDIVALKLDLHKVQFVLPDGKTAKEILEGFQIVSCGRQGKLVTATVRGDEVRIVERMKKEASVFYEVLPLSLEEIFISETEAVGYDLKDII
ncbi:ABC transporter ATP-binding protein [[Clostridium] polysaccharolyticum]|uniref:ABC-2 type transport system ATP-binding protein n=1 Tax=[Clostridium] polysaccharolyticum TaxID=29364 RepID=A0A1I0B7C7_9FIRM|nr:ABC transporter ATP-binding protein [[Clostridium] polysaccharolyticum]SET02700.1 ABC-2 type transport system ATP-binding protein [[Clostridium] polysaccharolyticum]